MANIICLWQELLCHIHEYCSLDYFISEGKHNIKHKSLSKHILLHAIAADSTFQIWFTLTIYTKVLLENKCQYSPAILVTASGRSWLPSKRHISYVQRKPRKLFYKLISIFTITTSWYFCQNTVKTALLKMCQCNNTTGSVFGLYWLFGHRGLTSTIFSIMSNASCEECINMGLQIPVRH